MANIAIVGGGVAGLSAGIYAQMNGHHATIYERLLKAGGNLTGWDRDGYHIDNCIHWLTGTNPLTSLYQTWTELGALGNVEVYQPHALYTFEGDAQQISLCRSIDKLREDMLKISPEDKTEILLFIKAVKAIQRLNGIAGKDNTEKSTLLQKLLSIPGLLRYYNLTTGELARRFKHPLLRGFIESFMTGDFSSLALITVFATFTSGNGDIPDGYSCAMAERMTERFLNLGGVLRLGKSVAKVNVKGGAAESVTLEDGSVDGADYVIITTDPAVAFGTLLDKSLMPEAMKRQYGDPKMKRFSSYHCAFSCDSAELPFRGEVIFGIPREYTGDLYTDYLMLREFSHEKGFAPEGKNIIQTMTFLHEEEACELIELSKDKEAYSEWKRKIANEIEHIMIDKYPSLRNKLRCLDVWTPATYKRFVGSEIGSFMSFAFPAAYLPTKLPNKIKGLNNVILATQWLQAPGGLPIAAAVGIDAIKAITKREGVHK